MENRAIKTNQRLGSFSCCLLLLLNSCVFQDWSPGSANKRPHSEGLWTHRGALIEKSLALSHPSITCTPNPSVPTSSLTPNLICCLYFPQRQLPFLHRAQMLLSPNTSFAASCVILAAPTPELLTEFTTQTCQRRCATQCNLWLIPSQRLLSPVSTVIVWGGYKSGDRLTLAVPFQLLTECLLFLVWVQEEL